jgi:hypothetical protein
VSHRPGRLAAAVRLIVICVFASCGEDRGDVDGREPAVTESGQGATERGPLAGTATLTRIGEIRLVEGAVPVGRVRGVALHPAGDRLAVADDMNGQIHVFDLEGNRVQVLGRAGEGPGEYALLSDIVWLTDGRLVASDARADRLTFYADDLALDTTVTLPPLTRPSTLHETPMGDLLIVLGTRTGQDRLMEVTSSGEVLRTFFRPEPDPADVPYWTALLTEVAAPTRDGTAVATNLKFPIYLLDATGAATDSITEPPTSWNPAPEPELGAFAGTRQSAFTTEYLPGITKISRLDLVLDSLLMVTYARFAPEQRDRWRSVDYALRLFRGARPVTDEWPLEARGRLVAVSDSLVLMLDASPTSVDDDAAWVLSLFRVQVS